MASVVLELPCGGETHRIELRADGTARMLDHSEDMVRSFMAFGADAPSCFVILQQLQCVERNYQDATGQWTHVQWGDRPVGGNQIRTEDMRADELERLLEAAKASEADRVQEAQEEFDTATLKLRLIERSMGRCPDASRDYPVRGRLLKPERRQRKAKEVLEKHRALVEEYEQALDYVRSVEVAAQEAEKRMAEAREAFLEGDFYLANGRARAALAQITSAHGRSVWKLYSDMLVMLEDMTSVFDVRVSK